jgi:hypothetical protein
VPASDAPLRTLKKKGLVTDGVEMLVRIDAAGHLGGSARFYCALNRDAARLARLGASNDARRLAKKALKLERSVGCKRVVTLFNQMRHTRPGWHAYVDALDHKDFRDAVLVFAAEVEAARRADPAAERATVSTEGEVVAIRGGVAELRATDGTVVPISRRRLEPLGLNWLGAPVVIHREDDSGGMIVRLEPGVRDEARAKSEEPLLDVGGDVPDEVNEYAYGGLRLRSKRASDAIEAMLARPPVG